ncbi:hypothetical protein H2508_13775 [Parahaliea sp. F7430]|uniref:Uncharacterized protein n=1 Tax=Sediminihaliea albiluteola TaxID=2758564 RepID=A0A7W2TYN1_9GAMM|nr:hypothetical protein [Sediminihaliea albiluteola]MBA6414179.1 hypothetical protein [Sediminihaliea albiluteola]
MSIGASGRIVVEIDPSLKQELHAALRQEGLNLKSWFLDNAEKYLANKGLSEVADKDAEEHIRGLE